MYPSPRLVTLPPFSSPIKLFFIIAAAAAVTVELYFFSVSFSPFALYFFPCILPAFFFSTRARERGSIDENEKNPLPPAKSKLFEIKKVYSIFVFLLPSAFFFFSLISDSSEKVDNSNRRVSFPQNENSRASFFNLNVDRTKSRARMGHRKTITAAF